MSVRNGNHQISLISLDCYTYFLSHLRCKIAKRNHRSERKGEFSGLFAETAGGSVNARQHLLIGAGTEARWREKSKHSLRSWRVCAGSSRPPKARASCLPSIPPPRCRQTGVRGRRCWKRVFLTSLLSGSVAAVARWRVSGDRLGIAAAGPRLGESQT